VTAIAHEPARNVGAGGGVRSALDRFAA